MIKTEIKLMIVEDEESDLEVCRDSIDVYMSKKMDEGIALKIGLIEFKSVKEACIGIDNSFDGAIIDMNFHLGEGTGREVFEKIRNKLFRIPVIVLTATPNFIGEGDRKYLINVLKKGETDYQKDILDVFYDIYQTGLTHIMGGRGKIEETLNTVYLENLLPQLDIWKAYGKADSASTEKALLRFTLNHLLQLLDDDGDECFPEEVYIHPPLSTGFKTGSIIQAKDGKDFYVILNPACDLVIRKDGQMNTDRILLVQIDEEQKILGYNLKKNGSAEDKLKELKTILSNRNQYHHWLPKTTFFGGGFINFRKLSSFSKKDCSKQFEKPYLQISPHFVKDILSRFSSYYARQGQPEIKNDEIITQIISSMEN